MDESVSPALNDMLENGVLASLDADALEDFIQGEGLKVLFFTGGPRRVRESHDVAVALREILKSWPGQVRAAVLHQDIENANQERFRVITPPGLVFLVGGINLEVVAGVRDWADYEAAFQRYLGAPQQQVKVS